MTARSKQVPNLGESYKNRCVQTNRPATERDIEVPIFPGSSKQQSYLHSGTQQLCNQESTLEPGSSVTQGLLLWVPSSCRHPFNPRSIRFLTVCRGSCPDVRFLFSFNIALKEAKKKKAGLGEIWSANALEISHFLTECMTVNSDRQWLSTRHLLAVRSQLLNEERHNLPIFSFKSSTLNRFTH